MNATKRIIVLANSVKHAPGRCIAGRELLPNPASTASLGQWIRPVSTVGEGQLYAHHYSIQGGGPVRLFDIFDIPLKGFCADPVQSENWLIDDSTPWQRVGAWPSTSSQSLYETPASLWLDPTTKTDRASTGFIASQGGGRSLYFIPTAGASIGKDYFRQTRYRLSFSHGGSHYDLLITDPAFHPSDLIRTPVAACISLAPPFKGFHYKLVASIIW